MSVIRAFVAIELPGELSKHLDAVIVQLKDRLPNAPVRWVSTGNMHLTLKFLGDVSVANLDLLKEVLQAVVSEHHAFEFSVGGLGAYPAIRRPRVIWVGIEAPAELSAVQNALENRLARLGYAPEERPFSPHLTLGRVSRTASPNEAQKIAEAIQSMKVGFLGAVHVQDIKLFRSELKPSGAEYSCIFNTPLNARG